MHERLGRRHAVDPRDYPAARYLDLEKPREAEIRGVTTPAYRNWYEPWNVDQVGPTCVANTAYHVLGDGPVTRKALTLEAAPLRASLPAAATPSTGYVSQNSGQGGFRGHAYDLAQTVDEFSDTPPEGGTSFRAMAKVLLASGLIGSYLWVTTADEAALAVLNHGPVALGCDWHEDDFYGVTGGHVMTGTGPVVGGHEVCLSGYVQSTQRFRVQTWGMHLYCPKNVLSSLLRTGDACVVTEPPTL